MDIIFSANNNEQILTLPVILENMPEFSQSYKNSTFESVNGELKHLEQFHFLVFSK